MKTCNIISHRGSNRIAPQNTLPAFAQSIDFHVDGFETDVHLTKDGIPVIHHNYSIEETSDGEGNIRDMTLAQLKSFDFGSYFHPSYKNTKIPTLDEFLKLCEVARLKIMNIEIKPPLDGNYKIVDNVIDAVKNHNLFSELLISSFDPDALISAKNYDENCKTAFLYSPNNSDYRKYWKDITKLGKSIGIDALHPHMFFVNKSYVEKAHESGIQVNPWTVNRVIDIKRLINCGVDGLITDVPNVVAKTIIKINEI